MARVPLRTNCLQAARWWAVAQTFRPLASPRRPSATTGAHSKMPRETTSAVIAAFRLLRGPESSTRRVEITAWAQRALGAKNTLTCNGSCGGASDNSISLLTRRFLSHFRFEVLNDLSHGIIDPKRGVSIVLLYTLLQYVPSKPDPTLIFDETGPNIN
jgi:hypothetical protein